MSSAGGIADGPSDSDDGEGGCGMASANTASKHEASEETACDDDAVVVVDDVDP